MAEPLQQPFCSIVQNPRQISATVSNQCENENTKKPVINEREVEESLRLTDQVCCKTISTQTGDNDFEKCSKTTNLLQYKNAKQVKRSENLSKKIEEKNNKLSLLNIYYIS